MTSTRRTATATLTGLGSLTGHHGGDYLIQADCDAQRKQDRDWKGRLSLARHAATYALTQALTKSALYKVAGHRVHPAAQAAGALTESVLHALIDDGRLLKLYATKTGKGRFHDLADHGINGRALLDQAAHQQLQIPIGIAITTAVDAWLHRR